MTIKRNCCQFATMGTSNPLLRPHFKSPDYSLLRFVVSPDVTTILPVDGRQDSAL